MIYREVLIICHANTSRSIMAEALLKKMLVECGVDGVAVRSGGIAPYARDGALVSMDARLALRDEGIHIASDHVATDLKRNRHRIASADLILAMTRQQIAMLASFDEAIDKEVYTLKEFAGGGGDIEDPQGKDDRVYAECRDEIKSCLNAIVPRLAK